MSTTAVRRVAERMQSRTGAHENSGPFEASHPEESSFFVEQIGYVAHANTGSVGQQRRVCGVWLCSSSLILEVMNGLRFARLFEGW